MIFFENESLLGLSHKTLQVALTLTILFPKLSKNFISKMTNVLLHGFASAQTKRTKLSTNFFQNRLHIVLKFINMINTVISWKFYPQRG